MTYDYHADYTRVSKSMLDVFLASPYEYYLTYVTQEMERPQPKRVMQIGSAVHAICLDKLEPNQVLAIYTDDCYKHGKDGRQCGLNPNTAEQFREQHRNRICLKHEDAEIVLGCVEAIRNHPLGELLKFPEARFEEPQFWTCPYSGLDCRLMSDLLIVGDQCFCYDLKTTERPSPDEFDRVRKRFRYWLQDAHYSSGLRTVFGKPVEFKFWAVETKFPFRIVPYKFPDVVREEFTERYASTMLRLAQCYETGQWEDDWTKQVNYMTCTPWEFGDDAALLDYEESPCEE